MSLPNLWIWATTPVCLAEKLSLLCPSVTDKRCISVSEQRLKNRLIAWNLFSFALFYAPFLLYIVVIHLHLLYEEREREEEHRREGGEGERGEREGGGKDGEKRREMGGGGRGREGRREREKLKFLWYFAV